MGNWPQSSAAVPEPLYAKPQPLQRECVVPMVKPADFYADAIERLRAFAQKWYNEGDHPITPNIFRLSGDSFTTF